LDKTKPFGGRQAVWISKGGGTMHVRARMLRLFPTKPDDEPDLKILPAAGGFK
jgi:hypothetical protein